MKATNPLRARARRVARELARLHPEARCSLDHASPYQLLVATVLSAQTTDILVNKLTPALFARFPDAAALASATPEEVEALVSRVNYFRNKARNLIACARQVVEQHGGQVPRTMDELVALPGVGRKTANVVLGNAFGVPGLPVDTHVGRLSQRLGLTEHTAPPDIEEDLTALLPPREWLIFTHRLIYHGRQVCHARSPQCEECGLASLCPRVGLIDKKGPQAIQGTLALRASKPA